MRVDPSSAVQKKHISKNALDLFTDREDFKETFLRHVNIVAAVESKVLVFYGVGGIGKTSLIRKLGQELDAAQVPFPVPRLPHARFDLENVESVVRAYREVKSRIIAS